MGFLHLYVNNVIDRPTVSISASSAHANFPPRNVVHPFLTRPWRTGEAQQPEYLNFNLGPNVAFNALIVAGHNLRSDDAPKLEGFQAQPDSNATGDVTFELVSLGSLLVPKYKVQDKDVVSARFEPPNMQFWRLKFSKGTAGTRDVGRIFFGTADSLSQNPDYGGYSEAREDQSRTEQTPSGHIYSERRPVRKRYNFTFSHARDGMKQQLEQIAAVVGKHTPFWVEADGLWPQPKYVRFNSVPQASLAGEVASGAADDRYLWEMSLDLVEEL